MISKSLGINDKGNLTIGEIDAQLLAEKFKTPLYVMDEDLIRAACREYKTAAQKHFGENSRVMFASKAFCVKDMCRIAHEEGLGLDVVSGGEMYTALSAGVPAELLCLHGNCKTDEELQMAVQNGVGLIVSDSEEELLRIGRVAAPAGRVQKVMLRVTPGIEAHTHDFIKTGQIDSKFGVTLETGEAYEAFKEGFKIKNIDLVGAHCHIGSQIFDSEPFCEAARRLINLLADVRDATGRTAGMLNLGGGFGIAYTGEDSPQEYGKYIGHVAKALGETCAARDFPVPFIMFEPGRSIVGPAGTTVYRVGAVKNIPGVRKYVSVDGSMADNPRYIMYGSKYTVYRVSNPKEPGERITLAGRCCESGDILAKNIMLPPLKVGDLVAVAATGAYNYSMSSNYNRLPRPAVVMVKGGKARVSVKRETFEDLIRNDV